VEKLGKKAFVLDKRTVFPTASDRAQISVQKYNLLKILRLFFLEIF
jgi:hypothetical protein